LLALLKAARAACERDWLMILVAFWHGLRASEVTGFRRDAVRDGHLIIQRLKGSLRTVQPLVEHADPLLNEKPALIELAAKSKPNQTVFNLSRSQFWRLVQKHAKAAGIPGHKAHPHVLKHSIAMQTIGSAGIENVRQYLGHKSISSTGAYLKVNDADASTAVTNAFREEVLCNQSLVDASREWFLERPQMEVRESDTNAHGAMRARNCTRFTKK